MKTNVKSTPGSMYGTTALGRAMKKSSQLWIADRGRKRRKCQAGFQRWHCYQRHRAHRLQIVRRVPHSNQRTGPPNSKENTAHERVHKPPESADEVRARFLFDKKDEWLSAVQAAGM